LFYFEGKAEGVDGRASRGSTTYNSSEVVETVGSSSNWSRRVDKFWRFRTV
jgi:hypothetical protein